MRSEINPFAKYKLDPRLSSLEELRRRNMQDLRAATSLAENLGLEKKQDDSLLMKQVLDISSQHRTGSLFAKMNRLSNCCKVMPGKTLSSNLLPLMAISLIIVTL